MTQIRYFMRKGKEKDYKRFDISLFDRIAAAIRVEKQLLEVGSLSLLWSYDDGYAVVALNERDEPVGYTRLSILLGPDLEDNNRRWLELGSTYVHKDYRDNGINKAMYRLLLPEHAHKDNILATTTNVASIAVGEDFGFVPVERKKLPIKVWKNSCSCPLEKTSASSMTNDDCKLAHGEPQKLHGVTACWFRLTPETAAHLQLESCMA